MNFNATINITQLDKLASQCTALGGTNFDGRYCHIPSLAEKCKEQLGGVFDGRYCHTPSQWLSTAAGTTTVGVDNGMWMWVIGLLVVAAAAFAYTKMNSRY